jgi:hypothetical protein
MTEPTITVEAHLKLLAWFEKLYRTGDEGSPSEEPTDEAMGAALTWAIATLRLVPLLEAVAEAARAEIADCVFTTGVPPNRRYLTTKQALKELDAARKP